MSRTGASTSSPAATWEPLRNPPGREPRGIPHDRALSRGAWRAVSNGDRHDDSTCAPAPAKWLQQAESYGRPEWPQAVQVLFADFASRWRFPN